LDKTGTHVDKVLVRVGYSVVPEGHPDPGSIMKNYIYVYLPGWAKGQILAQHGGMHTAARYFYLKKTWLSPHYLW
jgi:hypothetical protein